MKESRNWSRALPKPHLLGLGLAAILLLGAVGCGGGGGSSDGDGSSDSDQITKALRSYYEHPDPQKCESFTTERYRDTVYGGSGAGALSACKTHQSERQAMPALNRTAFVNHVRVDGDHAVAEVQGGGITITESLVKSGGGWRLADEQSPFSPPPGGGVTLKPYAPQAFGTPETFTNIPGISSPAAVSIVAQLSDRSRPGADRRRTGVWANRQRLRQARPGRRTALHQPPGHPDQHRQDSVSGGSRRLRLRQVQSRIHAAGPPRHRPAGQPAGARARLDRRRGQGHRTRHQHDPVPHLRGPGRRPNRQMEGRTERPQQPQHRRQHGTARRRDLPTIAREVAARRGG